MPRVLYGRATWTVRTVQSSPFFACLPFRTERDIFSIRAPFDEVNIPPESGRRDGRNGTGFVAFRALSFLSIFQALSGFWIRFRIIGDTLYHRGIDTILQQCLIHAEVERVMNDCHLGACGGHLSGMATAQNILRVGYFWPSIFKDCIEAVKKCPPCQVFNNKACTHPTMLHPLSPSAPLPSGVSIHAM
jgi:hypothetical protein